MEEKNAEFESYWPAILGGYGALLGLTIAYCYLYDSPRAPGVVLIGMLAAVAVVFAMTVAIGVWSMKTGARGRGVVMVAAALAGLILLYVASRAINESQSRRALATAIMAVRSKEGSAVKETEKLKVVGCNHFILLRMKDGREFTVQVRGKGRSFQTFEIVEDLEK